MIRWKIICFSTDTLEVSSSSPTAKELDLDFLEKRHQHQHHQQQQQQQQNVQQQQQSNNIKDETCSPVEISPEYIDLVKIILLGAPAVGKTSIIQQFVLNHYQDEYITTDKKYTYYPTVVTNERWYKIKITDLPVIPYFPVNSFYEWTNYRYYGLRSATAYILVFDLSNIETFQYIKTIREQIYESRNMQNVPLLVVGNKEDLIVATEQTLTNTITNSGISSTSASIVATSGPSGSSSAAAASGAGTMSGIAAASSSSNSKTALAAHNSNNEERRRDIVNLVKKHWKCGYIECSAKYNWRVMHVFKELMNMIENISSRDQSPMIDNIQEALDRNKCIVI